LGLKPWAPGSNGTVRPPRPACASEASGAGRPNGNSGRRSTRPRPTIALELNKPTSFYKISYILGVQKRVLVNIHGFIGEETDDLKALICELNGFRAD